MKNQLLATTIAVIALVVSFGAFVTPGPAGQDGKDGETLGRSVINTFLEVGGYFVKGGGVTTVVQQSATHTLTFDQLQNANVVTFTASSTQPALTVTLPATSTFPLPLTAGSERSWIIENPFTAAATTTTIAAGTGIDLQEVDGGNVVIGINNYAFVTCVRLPDTDIMCRVDETIPAD